MLYFAQQQLLFTHISRTAGVSIGTALRRAFPNGQELIGQHAALPEARPILGDRFDACFKFAVVRNPWERMLSWYALLGLKALPAGTDPASLEDPDASHWKSFDAFLDSWLAEQTIVDGVSRCKLSQWGQLADAEGTILADEVVRFEHLEEGLGRVFERLGVDLATLPRLNPSPHAHYDLYYSEYGRELVEKSAPEDVACFGYRFAGSQ